MFPLEPKFWLRPCLAPQILESRKPHARTLYVCMPNDRNIRPHVSLFQLRMKGLKSGVDDLQMVTEVFWINITETEDVDSNASTRITAKVHNF